MSFRCRIQFIAIVFFAAAISSAHAFDWWHIGFLFDEFPLTLSEGERTEALGPLFYSEKSGSEKTWGVPPLFFNYEDFAIDRHQFVAGYPVFSYNRYGTEYRWQLIQLFSFAGGYDRGESDTKRFTIFPIYFRQTSPNTNLNYTAFLPFYGRLKNRIFSDELFFVMFPLYCKKVKGDVTTEYYPFPFVSKRRGEALEGWKVFPFAGHEHKDPTTRTNGFGDLERIPGHDSGFIMAPFYLYQITGIG